MTRDGDVSNGESGRGRAEKWNSSQEGANQEGAGYWTVRGAAEAGRAGEIGEDGRA
jgi:hypothetical protein